MSFLKFIIKNPFRRKTSAILSIIGICIGIVVIVALGGITNGLVSSFEDTIHAGFMLEVPIFPFQVKKRVTLLMVPILLMQIGLIK